MKANKWLLLFLAVCLVFSLAACSGGGGGADTTADNGDDPAGGGGNGGGNGGNGGGNSAPAGPWLCFTATGSSTVSMIKTGTLNPIPTLVYSKDSSSWTDFVIGTTTVGLADGEKVYFRAKSTNNSFSNYIDVNNYRCIKFKMTGSIAASGNLMSLLDKDCETKVIPNDYCFYNLFSNCKSLTTAPELPATTLTASCYQFMFFLCTNLTTAPELPATTLTTSCYTNMFQGCSSLTTAPELPATTLAELCYASMFYGCSKLENITVHFISWVGATNATFLWVDGDDPTKKVPPGGTFTCPNVLSEEYGVSRIPDGWTYDNSL